MTISMENNVDNVPQENITKSDTIQTQKNIESVQTQQPKESSTQETQEDPNWRAFREARKRDRAEKEAAEKRAAEKEAEAAAFKAAFEAAFSKNGQLPQHAQSSYEEYQQEESEDEKIEKKVNALLKKKEEEAERNRQIREQQEYPARLQQTYHDFNQTISSDNLDYLEYHYPEVAAPLKRLPDGFDKWADIYRAIKKFVPNHANAKKEAAKAEANFNKPRSMSATGLTQTSEGRLSTILSDERKAANWERMQRTLKGIS